jgi:hypothetical protein
MNCSGSVLLRVSTKLLGWCKKMMFMFMQRMGRRLAKHFQDYVTLVPSALPPMTELHIHLSFERSLGGKDVSHYLSHIQISEVVIIKIDLSTVLYSTHVSRCNTTAVWPST